MMFVIIRIDPLMLIYIPVEYEVRQTCLNYSIHMTLLKCFLMTCQFSNRENMLNENGQPMTHAR